MFLIKPPGQSGFTTSIYALPRSVWSTGQKPVILLSHYIFNKDGLNVGRVLFSISSAFKVTFKKFIKAKLNITSLPSFSKKKKISKS